MAPFLLLAALLAAGPATPLTLDEALELAAKSNVDLRLAGLQGETAGVDAYASYANVLPRLDVTSSFVRSYYGPQQIVTTAPQQVGTDPNTGLPVYSFSKFVQQEVELPGQNVNNYTLGVTLQQPLFDGLRGPRLIERAKWGETAATKQVDETALNVSFEVTRRFYEVVKADRGIAVLEESVARSDDFVRRTDALFEAGRVPKSDALTARVNLANDRISLESQRARATQARVDLAVAVGVPSEAIGPVAAPFDVDRTGPAVPEPPPVPGLIEKAKSARPAFSRAQALVEQARVDSRLASWDRWPVMTGSLSYNRNGPTLASWSHGVWGDPTRQYVATAQLSVQWNLFNGRQTSANEQRAAINERTAWAQAAQLAVQVEGELVRARSNVIALNHSVELAEESIRAAEEGVRLAQQRLEVGAATQLEVRDANLKLTQAKLTLVDARIDALVARADLNRATGGAL